jgi:hypothetical protein
MAAGWRQHARSWVSWIGKTTVQAMSLWGIYYSILHHDDHGALLFVILLAVTDR